MSKVTVMLLSHNRPQLVKQTIYSVLWQTLEDFELLIIENSTDNETKQVVESFTDDRIKIYYEDPSEQDSSKQAIVPVYFNKYVGVAQGKYIFLLSDDDLLLPSCLEELYEFCESRGVACAYMGQFWMDYAEGSWKMKEHREYDVLFHKGHQPSCIIGGSSVLVRKDCFDEIEQPYYPLEPALSGMADGLFLDKVAIKFNIYPIKKTCMIYRWHSGRGWG